MNVTTLSRATLIVCGIVIVVIPGAVHEANGTPDDVRRSGPGGPAPFARAPTRAEGQPVADKKGARFITFGDCCRGFTAQSTSVWT